MTAPPKLAAILATGTPERLYSGLSVLVSTAVDAPCAALLTFRALDLFLAGDLLRRAQEPDSTAELAWAGRERFAASLVELVDTARSLERLALYACAASVDTMELTPADVEDRLDGVMSTPRFLRETDGATLIFV